MKNEEKTQTTRENPIFNLIGFVMILAIAWHQDWKSSDLIWSLWLGSLLIGYFTIAATVLAGLILVGKMVSAGISEHAMTTKQAWGLSGGAALVALFIMAFFSFHFCGFDAGHGMFLSHFFPLNEIDLEKLGFFDAFMNPLLLMKIALGKIAPHYIWFFIPALLIEWRKIGVPLIQALKFELKDPSEMKIKKLDRSTVPKDLFAGPYKNVMRMHLLIFFFAGAHFLKVDNFLIYAVVYAVYFFPWSKVSFRSGKENPASTTVALQSEGK